MASVFVSSPSEIVIIDARTRSGTITLPLTNSIPYRVLQFKDQYGAFSNSTLTLSTQTGEVFDDGTTSKTFSNAFGFVSLYATSTRWMVMNATQTVQQTISSLAVNQLTIGSGSGWIQLGPIQAPIVSSIQTNTQSNYTNTLFLGGTSSATTVEFFGLTGAYTNTVLAEVSTGTGTQEFLVFKGSSVSDRVRIQTTGNFVVETGVSARTWNDNTGATLPLATPAFLVTSASNVGIQTASPATALDVAGTVRAPTLSTQSLLLSSLNGLLFGTPISTVAAFTSNTALSVSSLHGVVSSGLSTIALFTSNTSNYSRGFLQDYSSAVSTVALFTSNSSNYAQNLLQNTSTWISTVALFTSNSSNYAQNLLQNTSTWISSVALFTSNSSNYAQNLLQNTSTWISTVALFTSNSSNYAQNLLQDYSTPVISTAIGLGSLRYLSSLSSFNYSTGTLSLSSLAIIDGVNISRNFLTVSSGILKLNGVALNAPLGSFSNLAIGKLNADQAIPSAADQTIQWVADVDPQSWIKNPGTSNARFLPSVAGYYCVTYQLWWSATSGSNQDNIQMRKNGTTFSIVQSPLPTASGNTQATTKVVYLNGSTDYVDFTAFSGAAAGQNALYGGTPTGQGTFFSAFLLSAGGGGGGGDVSQILAGSNIIVSPSDGKGAVTVNVGGLPAFTPNYSQVLSAKVNVPLSGPWPYTVVSTTITTNGNPVFVTVCGDAENVSGGAWCYFQLYRGTTALGKQVWTESSAASENNPYSVSVIDNPPAGTYVYALKVNQMAGSAFNFGEVDGPTLSATEMAGGGGVLPIYVTSTLQGLGTSGYISTTQLYSTTAGLIARPSGGSTLSSLYVGSSTTQNFIKFWGRIGEYNNSVLAEQSTGTLTGEFLTFKGSSVNDQIRFQTTGAIRFETGVTAPRDINSAAQIATPTMIMTSGSNIGVLTNNPSFTVDVTGTGRFTTLLSTASLYAGAIYGGVFFA